MVSPTRKGIRSDVAGDGRHNAPRGSRRHNGIDFLCTPGQDVYMPIKEGMIVRKRFPYKDDLKYEGIHIVGVENGCPIEVILFYVVPIVAYHINYRQGDVIAYAQDISKKYGYPMEPHIHLRIDRVDPLLLFEQGKLWDFTEYA